jgi:septal ring-binding cell division protein DamX
LNDLFMHFSGRFIMNDQNTSTRTSFTRTVAIGCLALAIVSVGAAYALQQTAATQVAKAPAQERDLANSFSALPRPTVQPASATGSWWARRTDQNATGTAAPAKVGNTLRNPELSMPR